LKGEREREGKQRERRAPREKKPFSLRNKSCESTPFACQHPAALPGPAAELFFPTPPGRRYRGPGEAAPLLSQSIASPFTSFISARLLRESQAPALPCPERSPQPSRRSLDCLFCFLLVLVLFFFLLFVLCTRLSGVTVSLPPLPDPITFFHRQNVLINLLLLFPDLTWWPTQSTTLTKRSLRDKTRLTSEEQGKCLRGRVQFLTWTPTRTGADPGRGGPEEGLSLCRLYLCRTESFFLPLKRRSPPLPKQMSQPLMVCSSHEVDIRQVVRAIFPPSPPPVKRYPLNPAGE